MCSQRLSKISYSCCFTDFCWELPEYGYPEDCLNCSKVVKHCKAQRKALLAKYSVSTGVRRSCLGRSFKKQCLGYKSYLQLYLSQSSADILFYSLPILCRVSSNGSGSFLLFSTDELIANFKRHEPKALYQYTQHTMLQPVSFRCWHGKGTHKNTNDEHSCLPASENPNDLKGIHINIHIFSKTYRVKIVLILEINASKHHKSKIYAPLLRLVLQDNF